VVIARSETETWGPVGYVEVIATRGSARGAGVQERIFHILKEKYDQRAVSAMLSRGMKRK